VLRMTVLRTQLVPSRQPVPLAALLLAIGFCLGSCAAPQAEPQWIEREIGAGNDQLLMDCTALAIQKSGFPVSSGIDPNHLVVVSGWKISLAPFRRKGYREQCEVRYQRLAPRRYKVSIRVRHEMNDDILHPLDLTYAKWVSQPDDPNRARMVMQHIQSLLGTGVEIKPGT
jgi:hypothetical protein